MKTMKCMLAALLLCGVSLNTQAQDYYYTEDEIAIGVGYGSNTQILSAWEKAFTTMLSATVTNVITMGQVTGKASYETKYDLPPISVEYFHHINKVVGVGGIFVYQGSKEKMMADVVLNSSGSTSREKIGSASRNNFTIMPSLKFDWLRKHHYGLYSKLAVGASLLLSKSTVEGDGGKNKVDNNSDFMFNWHATLLGIEGGAENVRAFAELGFGEQGIVLAGLRYKF